MPLLSCHFLCFFPCASTFVWYFFLVLFFGSFALFQFSCRAVVHLMGVPCCQPLVLVPHAAVGGSCRRHHWPLAPVSRTRPPTPRLCISPVSRPSCRPSLQGVWTGCCLSTTLCCMVNSRAPRRPRWPGLDQTLTWDTGRTVTVHMLQLRKLSRLRRLLPLIQEGPPGLLTSPLWLPSHTKYAEFPMGTIILWALVPALGPAQEHVAITTNGMKMTGASN